MNLSNSALEKVKIIEDKKLEPSNNQMKYDIWNKPKMKTSECRTSCIKMGEGKGSVFLGENST